jgi:hypothetical protein
MNALANHGFLPRDGRAITADMLSQAFLDAMSFEPGSLQAVTDGTVSTGARGDGSFDLAESVLHNAVEHDASLSRDDTAVGDALNFNALIWNNTLKSFPGATITVDNAVLARQARIAAARVVNSQFNLTAGGAMGTLGEASLYLMVFGDIVEGNANTQFVRVMFGRASSHCIFARQSRTNVDRRRGGTPPIP